MVKFITSFQVGMSFSISSSSSFVAFLVSTVLSICSKMDIFVLSLTATAISLCNSSLSFLPSTFHPSVSFICEMTSSVLASNCKDSMTALSCGWYCSLLFINSLNFLDIYFIP